MTVLARAPLVRLDDELDAAVRRGTVITPTRRLARELGYAVDYQRSRTSQTWPTPDVLSIDAFLARCYRDCQDAAIPGAQAMLLPDKILAFAIARVAPNPAWLRHVDTFADAWRTANLYGIRSEDPQLADTENGRAYARWAHAFQRLLDDQDWATSAELPNRLIRLIDGPAGWRPPAAVALDASDVPPAVKRFLTASGIPGVASPEEPAAHVRHLVATTSGKEVALAALWARERLAAEPGARIGVVVAGLGPAFPAIERHLDAAFADVAETADYVNVSGGLSLGQEPVCRDALELLTFTADGLDYDGLVGLAASPYLDLPLPVRLPRRAHIDDLSHLPRLARLGRALRNTLQSGAWAPGMRRILDAAGWAKAGLDRRELLARQQFEECLTDLAFAVEVGAIRSWTVAVDGLRRLAGRRLFTPPANRQAPIVVLGRAESIGLTFDHLWLCGMHQAGWPPVPEPNPLLPLAMQRAAGVPALSLDQGISRAERMTARWQRGARHLVASYPATSDNGGAQAPSKLVADFEPVTVSGTVRRPAFTAHGHPWATARGIDLVRYVDQQAGRRKSLPHGDRDTHPGGASVVQDQSLCPFRAWARHRLNLRGDNRHDRFPSDSERGAIMHRVLAELCRQSRTRDEFAEINAAEVAAAVDGALPEHDWPRPYREREHERMTALTIEWLDKEARRPPFAVVAVEEPVDVDLGGLKLSLRIDRIDDVAAHGQGDGQTTGGKVLIDFKTGQVSVNHWGGARPEDPQLPLYAVAARTAVQGIAFARVRPQECRLSGVVDPDAIAGRFLSADDFAGVPFDALLGKWRETLIRLASEYQAGHAAVDPLRPVVCRRCHLHALCRVFE